MMMLMLITGTITHTTTDVWFPQLVEMIQAQQRRPVWMSEKKVCTVNMCAYCEHT